MGGLIHIHTQDKWVDSGETDDRLSDRKVIHDDRHGRMTD